MTMSDQQRKNIFYFLKWQNYFWYVISDIRFSSLVSDILRHINPSRSFYVKYLM